MSLGKKAAKLGKLSSIYVASDVLMAGLKFALRGVFSYFLVPAQMGIVLLAGSIISPLSVIMEMGLFAALKSWYFRAEEDERPDVIRTVFIGQVIQSVLFVVVLAIAGLWIADWVLDISLDEGKEVALDSHTTYLLWLMILAAAAFRGWMLLGRSLTVLQERAFTTVGITFLNYMSDIILGVVVIVLLGGLGMGRQLTVTIALALAGSWAIWIGLKASQGGRFVGSLFGKALRTGVGFIPHQLSGSLARPMVLLTLNKEGSTTAVGIFGIGIMFAELIEMPVTAVANATYPTLAGLMKDGSPDARRQHSRLYTLVVAGLCLMTVAICVGAPVVSRIFSSKYHAASSVVAIVVCGWLFQGAYRLIAQPIFFFGGGYWLSFATLSSTGVAMVLAWLLVPTYSMYGAAWALFGCYLSRLLVAAVVSNHKYPLPWEFTRIARALICTAGLVMLDIWLTGVLPPSLLILIPVKIAIVALMVAMIPVAGIISKGEFAYARDLIGEKWRRVKNRKKGPQQQPLPEGDSDDD